MDKQQFLSAVRGQLAGLPQEDLDRALDYFAEMIDDRVEDGMTEESAVAAIGSVDEAVAQILADMPLPRLVRERVRPRRALRAWEIVLLVLGSPVWLPLLAAAAIVFAALYLVLWVLVACAYILDGALAISALGCLAGAVLLLIFSTTAQAVFVLGMGLVCAGLAIAAVFACNAAAAATGRGTKRFALWTKSRLIRKEAAA